MEQARKREPRKMIYTIESDDEIELEITSDEDSDSEQIILSSNKKGVAATKKKPVKKSAFNLEFDDGEVCLTSS